MRFNRIIAIDWSGADRDDKLVASFAVVETVRDGKGWANPSVLRNPNGRSGSGNWSRDQFLLTLCEKLSAGEPRTLVVADFGFGYPYGAAKAVFGAENWWGMAREADRLMKTFGTARAAMLHLNESHGCFRFDGTERSSFAFYLRNDIAYYRATELALPHAISQFRAGAGAAVSFHTFTGLSFLHKMREKLGQDVFSIWPHEISGEEAVTGSEHVAVECYPAILPSVEGAYANDNIRDACKACEFASRWVDNPSSFEIPDVGFGRVNGVEFSSQISEEGWIWGCHLDAVPLAQK
jgi:hypothetical protein